MTAGLVVSRHKDSIVGEARKQRQERPLCPGRAPQFRDPGFNILDLDELGGVVEDGIRR